MPTIYRWFSVSLQARFAIKCNNYRYSYVAAEWNSCIAKRELIKLTYVHECTNANYSKLATRELTRNWNTSEQINPWLILALARMWKKKKKSLSSAQAIYSVERRVTSCFIRNYRGFFFSATHLSPISRCVETDDKVSLSLRARGIIINLLKTRY